MATAIDLAGRNVLEAVQTSVYPRVIDCPPRNLGDQLWMRLPKTGFS
ncbi:MAG: flotillin-like FloA family protein [Pirellulaceae bacterium]